MSAKAYVGCDPEFFIKSHRGVWVPAHTLDFSYKEMPVALGRGSVLRDGYAVEINPRFSHCRTEMIRNFWDCINKTNEKYKLSRQGYSLIAKSAVRVDLTGVKRWPDDVGDFGCEGSWNAYTGKHGGPKINGYTHPFRYAGGHFHASFGANATKASEWTKKAENVYLFIKMCDRFMGLISTYQVGGEAAGLRRKYYGKAGEFRFQEHPPYLGSLEYRTLGAEVFSHHALLSFHIGLFRNIYENFLKYAAHYDLRHEKQVQDAVNAGVYQKDLLDLIPDMPGWYDRLLLRKSRAFFNQIKHRDLLQAGPYEWNQLHIGNGKGWGEWCRTQGFDHRRAAADLRGDDNF